MTAILSAADPALSAVLLHMSDDDRAAALRYHENLMRDLYFDFSQKEMARLTELGFILHRGCGRYKELDLLFRFVEYCELLQKEAE